MAVKIDRIKLGNTHSIGGHSLAGNLTTNLIHKGLGEKGINFNPYVTQHDMHKTQHKKITNVRNAGDVASYFARHNKNTIQLNNYNY
jgi:hypothetical protein